MSWRIIADHLCGFARSVPLALRAECENPKSVNVNILAGSGRARDRLQHIGQDFNHLHREINVSRSSSLRPGPDNLQKSLPDPAVV